MKREMIRPEDIEIRSTRFKTLDNGACGVEVEWTTPDLTPNVKFNLYSLSYDLYREYCENETIFKWCKHVIYLNEIEIKNNRLNYMWRLVVEPLYNDEVDYIHIGKEEDDQ